MQKQPLELFRQMALIRQVELTLLDLFSQGLLQGTVHTCIGQEACAVGVVSALDKEKDIIFSNHRGHGHYLAYCDDVHGLIAEIMGKPSGVCHGIGGSQHLQFKNFYTNGIQGAGVPITAGMALAEKHKGNSVVSVVFIGDGTFGEGAIYEAFNIAALWEIPMMIVVENNLYAQSTPAADQHSGILSDRANSFGIPVTVVDGMDVQEVNQAARMIIAEIRKNSKPQMLFLNTYRFAPHSKGDDFRDPKEIKAYKQRDPLIVLEKIIGNKTCEQIKTSTKLFVSKTVEELLNNG